MSLSTLQPMRLLFAGLGVAGSAVGAAPAASQAPAPTETARSHLAAPLRLRPWGAALGGLGTGGARCDACTAAPAPLGVYASVAGGLRLGNRLFAGVFERRWEGALLETGQSSVARGVVAGATLRRGRWLGVAAHAEVAREDYRVGTYPDPVHLSGITLGTGLAFTLAPRWAIAPTVHVAGAFSPSAQLNRAPRVYTGVGLTLR